MKYINVFLFLALGQLSVAETETALSAQLNPVHYIEKANELKLAQDQQWIDLLHFRPTGLGLIRSQVKGSDFFLAKDGFKNADSELQATIKGLLSTEKLDEEHPICKFPARKMWLQKKIGISESAFPKPYCKLYLFYRERMKAHSISVVFSSYYADSPSSAFGHTLFKVNKKAKNEVGQNDLLDWGIGYAGVVTTDMALLYIYNGLTGGFKGEFSSVPYYMKVREYNDYEARDMWSYELNMTPEEIDFFLDHIWEVGDSYFDYYFLTQNCGFHMLTALEAAVPRYKLVDKVPLWVIPSDALKAITDTEGMVKDISWRPSLYAQLKARFDSLNIEEKKIFKKMQKSKSVTELANVSDDKSKAALMDAFVLFYDVENAKKIAADDPELLEERNKLLSYRSRLPSIDDIKIPPPSQSQPHISHPSARFMLIQQNDNKNYVGDVTQFNLRFALNDALDPSEGYPKYSTVEMFTFAAAHNRKLNSTHLSEFQFLNIESLAPIDEISFKKSWGAAVGWKRYFEPNCYDCSVTEAKVGWGLAGELVRDKLLGFGILYGRFQSSPDMEKGYDFVAEPRFGVISYLGTVGVRYFFAPKLNVVSQSYSWLKHEVEFRYNFKHKSTVQAQVTYEDSVTFLKGGVGFFF